MQQSPSGISNALVATVCATVAVVGIIFLTQSVFKVDQGFFVSILQAGIRSNSYLFLATAGSLYGEPGSTIAGVFVACTLVASNIVFIMAMNHDEKNWKKKCISIFRALIQNPLIFGCFVGLTFSALNFHITEIETAKNYLYYLANAATPLNLLSVGAGLNLAIQWEKIGFTAYASSLKLIIMPVCTMVMLQLLSVTGVVASIALLYSAVPCAGNAYIVSRRLGADAEMMSSITTWTTLMSLLTITFLLGLEKNSFL